MRMQPIESTLAEQPAFQETDREKAPPRRSYLCPARYFHFYVLYDRKHDQTCWLPEGYGA